MYSEFERMNVGIILAAMVLQADDEEWDVLEAQHAKGAPIVQQYGSIDHLRQLAGLESRMRRSKSRKALSPTG